MKTNIFELLEELANYFLGTKEECSEEEYELAKTAGMGGNSQNLLEDK